MGGATLPPGFRFHPTDEELVGYYLKRKVEGLEIELEVIPVIDFYKYDPWELPDKSFLPRRDLEWFFFCARDKKYPNGSRTNRATRAGYWKATGKDRKVVCQSSITGYRKTLVFYKGRAPLGDRTDWVMHEYRLCDDDYPQGSPNFKGAYALCHVVKKNENVRKQDETHGDGNSKMVESSSSSRNVALMEATNEPLSILTKTISQASNQHNANNFSNPVHSPFIPSVESSTTSMSFSPEMILDSSQDYWKVQGLSSECILQNGVQSSVPWWQPNGLQGASSSSSYSNINEASGPIGDVNGIACMSPYLDMMDYFMGHYGSESENFDLMNSQDYPGLF
ncbi:hypothetical protein Droror1_Dr00025686 [Drosera rotundifolia]